MDLCIPNDIVDDILLRLPANSLVRLRWSCKYWFDLITRDPSFIKMQYHSSTHDEIINNNPCVLIKNYEGDLSKRYFNYTTYNVSPEVKLDLPFKCKSFEFLSSCNGLILFQSCSTLDERLVLCIWNPCTKEYKVLPEPPMKFDYEKVKFGFGYDQFDYEKVKYGFGYDHTIDDYKVIRNACHNYETTTIQVYTARPNTWRSIHGRLDLCNRNDVGVFVNGALYWIISKRLFSFDIVKEKYHEILTGRDMDLFNRKLTAFEGCLCLLPTPSIYGGQMYVMNKENYSWTKVCPVTIAMTRTKPLRFTKNGNILMVGCSPGPPWCSHSDLILFNPKEGKSTNLNICHKSNVQEVYIESLVSLASDRTSKENEEDDVSIRKEIQMSAKFSWSSRDFVSTSYCG